MMQRTSIIRARPWPRTQRRAIQTTRAKRTRPHSKHSSRMRFTGPGPGRPNNPRLNCGLPTWLRGRMAIDRRVSVHSPPTPEQFPHRPQWTWNSLSSPKFFITKCRKPQELHLRGLSILRRLPQSRQLPGPEENCSPLVPLTARQTLHTRGPYLFQHRHHFKMEVEALRRRTMAQLTGLRTLQRPPSKCIHSGPVAMPSRVQRIRCQQWRGWRKRYNLVCERPTEAERRHLSNEQEAIAAVPEIEKNRTYLEDQVALRAHVRHPVPISSIDSQRPRAE